MFLNIFQGFYYKNMVKISNAKQFHKIANIVSVSFVEVIKQRSLLKAILLSVNTRRFIIVVVSY